jgi:hypothetical protein
VVFHKGCIVENGTHEQLLQLGGVYARLHQLQFAAAKRVTSASEVAAPSRTAAIAGRSGN